MTVLPTSWLDSDDDWIECLRRYLWPKLDRVWPHSTMVVDDSGFVAAVDVCEEVLEGALESLGFIRNPVAALKLHQDGRTSEGSWVLLPEDDPTDSLEDHEQLHLTFFRASNGVVDLYAHVETDWRDDPIGHLLNGGSLERGQRILTELLDNYTYMSDYSK